MSDHDIRSDIPRFSVTSRRSGHILHVRVSGELDACTAAGFRDQTGILLAGEIHCIELDLADVGFCDVRGARELLRIHHHATQRGTEFTVMAASRPVQILMDLLGIGPWAGPPPPGQRLA